MGMILVQVMCGGLEEAEAIGRGLLEARLVACASVGPGWRSRYWWRGNLESSEEVMLLLKTSRERFGEVEAAVRKLHAHETPEIVAIEVAEGSADYLRRVEGEVGKR